MQCQNITRPRSTRTIDTSEYFRKSVTHYAAAKTELNYGETHEKPLRKLNSDG